MTPVYAILRLPLPLSNSSLPDAVSVNMLALLGAYTMVNCWPTTSVRSGSVTVTGEVLVKMSIASLMPTLTAVALLVTTRDCKPLSSESLL
jgi:hypothetical protein